MYNSWISNTISQPLQMAVDINYVVDYRGKNYFTLLIKKIKPVVEKIILYVKNIILKPQFVIGNFSILSPPKLSYNSNLLYPHFLLETIYSNGIVVT